MFLYNLYFRFEVTKLDASHEFQGNLLGTYLYFQSQRGLGRMFDSFV